MTYSENLLLCANYHNQIYMWASRREPEPKTKSSRSHFKISIKMTEICWRCLRATVRYFVQIIIPRSTHGPHVESRTLKLKARVHTIKFQQIWLKFVGDILKWLSTTLCKLSYIDPHVGPDRESDPKTKNACSHLKISTNLTEICWKIKWPPATLCKLSYTRGPHVESRTLKLKARVHTLKFQQICLKFVGNVLEWQPAILCKFVQLDPHVGPS
jgi:hypothetical protein